MTTQPQPSDLLPRLELARAAVGSGAWYEKGPAAAIRARVSQRELKNGLLLASQIDSFAKRQAADTWLALEKQAYVARTWGDGYGYLLVATGRAEVMIDP